MNSLYKQIYVTKKEPLVLEVSQDTTLPLIELEVEDWTIPGASSAQIYVEKPSGALIYNAATIDGNVIEITPTTQMTAEVGVNKGQIRIINGQDVLHTFVFYLKVFESIIDDSAIESTNEFTALEEALAEVNDAVTHTEVKNKGSATQPIYFDSDGLAQNTTYPLVLNALNQAGIVAAPTASDADKAWGTDTQGRPSWNNNFFKAKVVDFSDANTVSTMGVWAINAGDTGIANLPVAATGWLISIANSSSVNIQIFIRRNGDTYRRTQQNGTWGNWESFLPINKTVCGGIINGNSSITIPSGHFFGVFSFGGNYALVNAVETSIVFLINNGTTVDITYSSGSYTVTNKQASSGMRYHVAMGAYNVL